MAPAPAPQAEAPVPTFALNPPAQALTGTLTVTAGHALKFSRGGTEFTEASTGAQILHGESVATKEKSSAVAEISGIGKISMGPGAELVFANLFTNNLVLQQKNGSIHYEIKNPISVRILHALAVIQPGVVTISIDESIINVSVTSGSVKLGIVDTDNNTHVFNVTAGKTARINDDVRSVKTR